MHSTKVYNKEKHLTTLEQKEKEKKMENDKEWEEAQKAKSIYLKKIDDFKFKMRDLEKAN